jgi:hypothetical protein
MNGSYGYPSSGGDAAGQAVAAMLTGCWGIFWLAFAVVVVAAMWMLFTKAGKPGWAAIVPIYNSIVLLEIVGRPLWWIVLYFIPGVNFVVSIIVAIDLAKSFGKDVGFALGLIFLSPIFYAILGFGSSVYVGPAAAVAVAPAYYPPQPPQPFVPPAPPAYAPPTPPVYAPPAPPAPPVYAPPAPPAPPAYEPPEAPEPPAPPVEPAE